MCDSDVPVHVKDLLVGQEEVKSVKTSDTVDVALKLMSECGVTALPVQNAEGAWVGFVDTLDLLRFLVQVTTREESTVTSPASHSLFNDDIDTLVRRGHNFSLSTLSEGDLVDFSRRNPWLPVGPECPISEAIAIFSKGVHRLPVVQDGKLVHVLSQSDVVRHLASYSQTRLGKLAEKTPAQLGFLSKRVGYVRCSTITVDAFLRMHRETLSALAVVDDDGKLVGNISASDLKRVGLVNFRSLLWPVDKFLENANKQAPRALNAVAYVEINCKLAEIVEELATKKVKRVYLVDENHRPLSVVTLTDVLKSVMCSH